MWVCVGVVGFLEGLGFLRGFSFLLIVERVVDREIKEPPRNLDLEKFTKKNKKVPLDHKKEPPYLKKFTSRSRKKPHQSKKKSRSEKF